MCMPMFPLLLLVLRQYNDINRCQSIVSSPQKMDEPPGNQPKRYKRSLWSYKEFSFLSFVKKIERSQILSPFPF